MIGQQALSIVTRDLGLSPREAEALLGLHRNTLRKWSMGNSDTPVTPSMATFLRLLQHRPELVHTLERMRIEQGDW